MQTKRTIVRVRLWGRRVGLARRLAVALMVAVFLSGTATFAALTQSGPLGGHNPRTIFTLLILDAVLIVPLGLLIGLRIASLWAERRAGVAGARLHVRLVFLFSVVAITPAILVAVFSGFLINFGVEQWFNQRVSAAVEESLAVANAYLLEHQQAIGDEALWMAKEIREAPSGIRGGLPLLQSPYFLSQVLDAQATERGLSEAVVFDSKGNVIARYGMVFSSLDTIPDLAYQRARDGHVQVLTDPADRRVRALVLLASGNQEIFLYIGRYIDPKVLDHVQRTSSAVAEYQRLQGLRSGLEITFSLVYGLVALLLLMGAIWVGLTIATQLASPIISLINASERVRAGDLSVRVEHATGTDELGFLSRSFNRMTGQLDAQQRSLIKANKELDERRRFTEAVLEGVSAGVIGLDGEGCIELANRFAAEYLDMDPLSMIGGSLGTLVPELGALLQTVRERPERSVQTEITLTNDSATRSLLVRILAEQADSTVMGFVVTLDDITALMAAQRKAAWADVARRIAHEIKNPLTPIQLSAERLKRKYAKVIEHDRETFLACTDTIIRQVGDIGRMVDEFSNFARMPAPVMRENDLLELIRQAVFLARTGYPDVSFVATLPTSPLEVTCDSRQIGQAMTNLLKNAVEAIRGRTGEGLPKGHIAISVTKSADRVDVTVEDNGKGLPHELRDRLTEPYVTTQGKGTGLGLAIVKKIMEDHGGELTLDDLESGGARISLVFRLGPMDDKIGALEIVGTHGA